MERESINMECEPLKKVTLTEQIMEQIAGMITSGQLKPGDKLPNEEGPGRIVWCYEEPDTGRR